MTNITAAAIKNVSKEAINLQVQKIFQDSRFANSDILKRFFAFIVDQTLTGHSAWLKEYTIATHVLNKPVNFNPQQNGIVRIHAVRLRRALNQYYRAAGVNDAIRISIPRGSYVPVFAEYNDIITEDFSNDEKLLHARSVIGIVPFRHLKDDQLDKSLAEGLGVLLTKGLMRFQDVSVVAYYTMCNAFRETKDILSVPSSVGAQYIIAGDIQSVKSRIRIFVQLIRVNSNEQLWSQVYEKEVTDANLFEIQDELAQQIISDVNRSWDFTSARRRTASMMAVA